MRLSKQTSDAVEILVFCFRPGDALLKVADVASELGLSKQMALKLAYILNQAGFVEAVRGPRGGIRLTDMARDAKLGDIVRALEMQPVGRAKGVAGALIDGYVDEAFEAFLSVLDQHKLADLAKRPRKPPQKKSAKKATRKRGRATPIAGAARRKKAPPRSVRTAAV